MLRTKNKLTVRDDNNSSFTDYSAEALDYDRDTFTVTLNSSTSYLYVGFYKPINVFYAEMGTANTNAGSFVGQYYNGTTWASITNMYDETASFTRSGFVQWDRNLTDEAVVTIDSTELFWYRFRPSVTHSATVVNGLNIVFADDNDLKREYFEVSTFVPSTENSHILTHVASRDQIIQHLRNSGSFKQSTASGSVKDVTAFDILDLGQIKLAATYLALSKIFASVQDSADDIYIEKSKYFYSLYSSAIKTFYLDLDFDDDGITDEAEKLADNTGKLLRR
jgi:hypothetical protein